MCRSVEHWTLPGCSNGKAFWDSWVQSTNALSSHTTGGFEKHLILQSGRMFAPVTPTAVTTAKLHPLDGAV